MSGFDLVPVDGGERIHLPPGETVLGRGPLLGVSDKRVSRHHGLLDNLNGQLRLKPTHLNPCFVQPSLTDDPRPLQRDSWYPLEHGDLFSLLPGQFIYRVVAVGGGDSTPRNSQMFEEEEEELPAPPQPDEEPQTPPDEEPTDQEGADPRPDGSLTQGEDEAEDDQRDVTPCEPRRRVLPAWMMAAVAAPLGSSSGSKGQSAVKGSEGAAASKRTKTSSPEEERPTKRRRRRIRDDDEEEEEAQSKTDVPSAPPAVQLQSLRSRSEGDEGGRGGDVSTATPTNEDKESKNGRQMTKGVESVGSIGGAASRPTPSRPRLRAPCPYGKDCYRKNPVHFHECSHPGDTDYEEEEEEDEEEEADRPECPYGTDCYRKNPLHRKEYKHTKKPGFGSRSTSCHQSRSASEDPPGPIDFFVSSLNNVISSPSGPCDLVAPTHTRPPATFLMRIYCTDEKRVAPQCCVCISISPVTFRQQFMLGHSSQPPAC
uniref:aprataxin and PNK-like factor isoform X1 n=1 Tax=Scatophagus argus TaxID=75038 RepID=UPI001ED7FCCF|nr:aprataxin and PNK-like factor isoform X1 [Scatophagus argus]